jgi:hypothetical protein
MKLRRSEKTRNGPGALLNTAESKQRMPVLFAEQARAEAEAARQIAEEARKVAERAREEVAKLRQRLDKT